MAKSLITRNATLNALVAATATHEVIAYSAAPDSNGVGGTVISSGIVGHPIPMSTNDNFATASTVGRLPNATALVLNGTGAGFSIVAVAIRAIGGDIERFASVTPKVIASGEAYRIEPGDFEAVES